TSINTTGSVLGAGALSSLVMPAEGQVLVGTYAASLAAQTDGLLVKLNARILGGTTDQPIDVDSAFVWPAGPFIFVPQSGGVTRPTFQAAEQPTLYTVTALDSAGVYNACTADVDRDNYVDLIFSSAVDSGLFVAYGDADDTLSAPVRYLDVGPTGGSVTVDHLDADTLLDIVAVSHAYVYILLNRGNRLFSADSIPVSSPSPWNTVFAAPLDPEQDSGPSNAAGLFNDDYIKDIVYAPNTILFGDGNGDFSSSSTLPFSFDAVNAGDFNRDGHDDLLAIYADSVKIYTNDGTGSFTQSAAEYTATPVLEQPLVSAITDFNRDGHIDFAFVQPFAAVTDSSAIWVGLGNSLSDISLFSSIMVAGQAYDLVVQDADRDGIMDIIIANGTYQRLEIYPGDGIGGFGEPALLELPAGTDLTYALGTLDLDRDGNPDFIAGSPEGDNLLAAIDQSDGTTESLDEMVVTGYQSVTLEVTNPDGFVISQYYQTVAGGDYQRLDVDGDGSLDEESYDYNLKNGEYVIDIDRRPGEGEEEPFSIGIRINGTYQVMLFQDYVQNMMTARSPFAPPVDSIVFYYTVEDPSSIRPPNGQPSGSLTPRLNWTVLADQYPMAISFDLQVDSDYFFSAPLYDVTGLTQPSYVIPAPLTEDKIYYWRFRASDGTIYSDYSRTFALYASRCCVNNRGNANGDPEDKVNISDVSYLLAYLFGIPTGPEPPCRQESNANGDPDEKTNISDVSYLLAYLFGIPTGPPPPACP
ncbi:MAG: VCBS repeat-containing protein, partial [candidate division Zixibacteria bacterium]|nr:VCBS repeat-containing protein [candidate division Zixibacteria bacterium]